MNKKLSTQEVEKMNYVELLANIQEVNRPPGGKDSIRRVVQNTFLTKESAVLDVGCNTGYSAFEIAHLVQCSVTGIDISQDMINTANELKKDDAFESLINFQVADGMSLPFSDGVFDLTMSGGSTAFIPNKTAALKEYARVTKTWGFVADINFYYKQPPPPSLIADLNSMMEISIEPWEIAYWEDLYRKTNLETYYTYTNDVYVPSDHEIENYCEVMSRNVEAEDSARDLIKKRLQEIMTLFAENHKRLAYGVFIMRKRDKEEQIALFGR